MKPDMFRSLSALLENTASLLPDKEAVVYGDTRLTWGELNQMVDNLACAFLEAGVAQGDCIGIISTTRPEYLCVFLAVARIGAVLVGFNTLYTAPEIVRLAHLTQPRIMVVVDELKGRPFAESLITLFREFPFVEHTVVIGPQQPLGSRSFTDLAATPRRDLLPLLAERKALIQPEDSVLMVFTSGSTGIPKGAVLTHRSVLTTTLVQVREFMVLPDDRVLQNKPMSHVGGAINLTLPALAVGAALVFMDHFNPVRALEIVQKERITILAQVPTMFIMELNLPEFEQYDLSSLRLAIVGGAATPLPVMRQIMQITDTVITGYGMTETGGYITFTRADDAPDTIAATVGKIAPEYEVQIVDEMRNPVPLGETGEVALRGHCLFKEYSENPQATTEVFSADGWFFTGDVGYLDARGYLTLVDRRKEMYISGGYNVYPREIELHIAQHPGIELVAVIGVDDPVMGEVGLACYTPVPGMNLPVDSLRSFCQAGLAEYKIPRHFISMPSLPLTPLGKIDKPRLRQELLANGYRTD